MLSKKYPTLIPFYVVIQIKRVLLCFFIFSKKIKYLCSQEVKEEIGSAEEQPISNRFSALYSKSKGDGILLSLIYWYCFMAKKTFFFVFFYPVLK
jgi:hypothetical protein